MCSFNMWGIYGAAKPLTRSPYPSAITWLSSRGLTGGAVHLPPCTSPTLIPLSLISVFMTFITSLLTCCTLLSILLNKLYLLIEAHWVPPNWICWDAKCLNQGQLDNSRWRTVKNITHSARSIDNTEASRDYKNRHTLGLNKAEMVCNQLAWVAVLPLDCLLHFSIQNVSAEWIRLQLQV